MRRWGEPAARHVRSSKGLGRCLLLAVSWHAQLTRIGFHCVEPKAWPLVRRQPAWLEPQSSGEGRREVPTIYEDPPGT
eukprot:3270910-Pyramimonas_sp.AAC.1